MYKFLFIISFLFSSSSIAYSSSLITKANNNVAISNNVESTFSVEKGKLKKAKFIGYSEDRKTIINICIVNFDNGESSSLKNILKDDSFENNFSSLCVTCEDLRPTQQNEKSLDFIFNTNGTYFQVTRCK